ncbi:protein of unknown function [Paraburkholderia kururiensis]
MGNHRRQAVSAISHSLRRSRRPARRAAARRSLRRRARQRVPHRPAARLRDGRRARHVLHEGHARGRLLPRACALARWQALDAARRSARHRALGNRLGLANALLPRVDYRARRHLHVLQRQQHGLRRLRLRKSDGRNARRDRTTLNLDTGRGHDNLAQALFDGRRCPLGPDGAAVVQRQSAASARLHGLPPGPVR